ncbi:hypothetical protein NQZ68_017162 [Dissostichus eleginoides]|nr:hypothetical protein NQZ68_017162 [Dissostichus eleginoides]
MIAGGPASSGKLVAVCDPGRREAFLPSQDRQPMCPSGCYSNTVQDKSSSSSGKKSVKGTSAVQHLMKRNAHQR